MWGGSIWVLENYRCNSRIIRFHGEIRVGLTLPFHSSTSYPPPLQHLHGDPEAGQSILQGTMYQLCR